MRIQIFLRLSSHYLRQYKIWKERDHQYLPSSLHLHLSRHYHYPLFRLGQWGTPIFSIVGTSAMFIGILVSIIESVGNYISCAKMSGVTQPPRHAINRGIAMERVASMFAGLCGSGNGTTSYSENIAAIGVTRVRIFFKINVNIIFSM